MQELIVAALLSGGIVAALFQLFKRGTAMIAELDPIKMRIAVAILSVLVTLLGSAMNQELPTDLSAWSMETFTAVVTFLASQAWFLLKKVVGKN